MSQVICQGCGQAFAMPEGYTRNKIQCPGCGVICPVPVGGPAAPRSRRPAPARDVEADAADALAEPAARRASAPAPAPAPAPPASTTDPWGQGAVPLARDSLLPPEEGERGDPEPVKRIAPETWFNCRRCKARVRRQGECPFCDGAPLPVAGEPGGVSPGRGPAVALAPGEFAPHSLELDPPARPAADDEDDGNPYVLADRLMPRCPKCHKEFSREGAVVCVHCGFDLRTRRKVARTFKPMEMTWENNIPLRQRLVWFGVAQAGVLAMAMLVAATGAGAVVGVFMAWPLFALLMAFLVGTFDHIRITRDTRGRVAVIKTWRVCFVPLKPVTTEVHGFEGIVSGRYHDAGFWEWFLFFWLFPIGIIPALLWWWYVIRRDHFYVALARDHGYPEVYVYRGQRQEQLDDITATLREATGLRHDSE